MPAWIEHTLQDLRYAMRGLRRNPGFTVTTVVAAAIAIGASTAVFSAIDRILFRPLPYRDEGRLVSTGMMAPLDANEFLLADAYFDLRRSPGPFEAVTSFQAGAIACDLTEAESAADALPAGRGEFSGHAGRAAGGGAEFHGGGGPAERSAGGADFARAMAEPVRGRPGGHREDDQYRRRTDAGYRGAAGRFRDAYADGCRYPASRSAG